MMLILQYLRTSWSGSCACSTVAPTTRTVDHAEAIANLAAPEAEHSELFERYRRRIAN